jgi:chemotaxis response regulator CheB
MPDKDEKSNPPENRVPPDSSSAVNDRSAHPEQKAAEQEEDRAYARERIAADDADEETVESFPATPGNAALKTAFPIIGIGASAGGLEALESFFSALAAESGMAFVVVTHTDPEHQSLWKG